MIDCIFCKIIKKEVSSEILRETEDAVIFKDIRPSAPIHYLIVPKKHIASIKEISHEDEVLMGHLVHMAREVGDMLNLTGYKLIFNVGKEGGQVIDHVHLHLLGGWENGSNN